MNNDQKQTLKVVLVAILAGFLLALTGCEDMGSLEGFDAGISSDAKMTLSDSKIASDTLAYADVVSRATEGDLKLTCPIPASMIPDSLKGQSLLGYYHLEFKGNVIEACELTKNNALYSLSVPTELRTLKCPTSSEGVTSPAALCWTGKIRPGTGVMDAEGMSIRKSTVNWAALCFDGKFMGWIC